MHEGADRREAEVSRARRVPAVRLEVVQKPENQRCVEIGECQCRRQPSRPLFGISQQELERVAVARNRVRAGATFCDQTPLEEVLKQRWKGTRARHHDALSISDPAKRANR